MTNSNKSNKPLKGLWYDPVINRFTDDAGTIIHNLSDIFPTWRLDLWKKVQSYSLLRDKKNELWRFHYDEFNCELECGSNCRKCPSRCEIYELIYDEAPYKGE